jgi:hypothetical protein
VADDNLTTELVGTVHMNAVDLLRVEYAERQRILRMLGELEDDLVAAIRRNVGKSEITNTRLRSLLAQTRDTINTAYGDMSASNIENMGKVSQGMAYSITNAMNVAVGVDVASVAFSAGQLKSLADETYFMGRYLEEYWTDSGKKLYDNFTTQMRLGMLQGEGIDQLTRRVVGTKANSYTDGVMNQPRYQAEAIVRTATIGAANAGRTATYVDNADVLDGIQWVATLDDRICPICIALDGLMWTLPEDGDAESYGGFLPVGHDKEYPGPTAHVNCRCAQIPIVKSYEAMAEEEVLTEDELDAIPETVRESMDGAVSVRSFEDWLDTKPAGFIDDLLGPEQGAKWRAGTLDLKDLTNQSNRPLTTNQLLAKPEYGGGVSYKAGDAWQPLKFMENPPIDEPGALEAYGATQAGAEAALTDKFGKELASLVEANNKYVELAAAGPESKTASRAIFDLFDVQEAYRAQMLPAIRESLAVEDASHFMPKITNTAKTGGGKSFKLGAPLSAENKVAAQEALQNLASITDPALFERFGNTMRIAELGADSAEAIGGGGGASAWYQANTNSIIINKDWAVTTSATDRAGALMHEMIHQLQYISGNWKKELEFFNARGGVDYNWMDPYMKRVYARSPGGDVGAWEAREVMTVAVQYYYYAPEILASRDPGLFEFVYKMLHNIP